MKNNISRTQNVIHNSTWALSLLIFKCVFELVSRKLIVRFLYIEYLGLDSLFSNILGWFSFAELGIANIISYNLYRELSKENISEINILLAIYRKIYKIVGFFVIILGSIIVLFLPFFLRDAKVSIEFARIIFLVQLLGNASSYFLAYRRTLFICDQKEYVCIRVDTLLLLIGTAFRVFTIVVLRSFVAYTFVIFFEHIISNLIIYFICQKTYPFIVNVHVTRKEILDRHVFTDIKNIMIQKISFLVFNNTDSILISSFFGLRNTGIVSNYLFICMAIVRFMYALFKGIIPGVANLVNTSSEEKRSSVFSILDVVYFVLASVVFCDLVICMQNFIQLFWGKDHLMPFSFVLAIAVEYFNVIQFENVFNFRSAKGHFDKDRNYFIIAAVSNILFSLVFVKVWEITGIIVGSIIAFLPVALGRIRFVFKNVLTEASEKKYVLKHIVLSIVTFFQVRVVFFITSYLNVEKWIDLVFVFLISTLFIIVLQILLFFFTGDLKILLIFVKNFLFSKTNLCSRET